MRTLANGNGAVAEKDGDGAPAAVSNGDEDAAAVPKRARAKRATVAKSETRGPRA